MARYFIIAGERRCGTTSLMTTLRQHPQICLHPKRDGAWFVDDSARRRDVSGLVPWEEGHRIEDYRRWLSEACEGSTAAVIGEKSADYLFWKPAHERIGRLLPEARLLLVLRNPVKRAWSHYWNEVAKKREHLPFEEALAAEAQRLQGTDWERYNFSYLARGDYADSLAHLFRHVPRERVMVITLEQFAARRNETLAEICRFLEVQADFAFEERKVSSNANWAVVPRPFARQGAMRHVASTYGVVADALVKLVTRERTRRRSWRMKAKAPFFMPARDVRMPDETRRLLAEHFRPRKQALEDLLGRAFSEWEL